MSEQLPRSPYDAVKGLVYFPRMLDKIRLKAAEKLPKAYDEFLGTNFDGRCVNLLGVKYASLRERVVAGGTDEEIETWSGFMTKRGWRDEASDRIAFRLKEAGLERLDTQVATMFDFIEVDEGRTPPDFRKWQPPRFAKP